MSRKRRRIPHTDPRALAAVSANKPEIAGSKSGPFTLVTVGQLWGGIAVGETADPNMIGVQQDAALAALHGTGPRDVIEGMLAAQMVSTHNAAMECFRRANLPDQTFEGRRMALEFANKLVRSYAALVEAMNRHRGKGQQKVTVEHVHVHPGGQAIVGAVAHPGGGAIGKSEDQPHAKQLADASEPALRGADPEREPVPIARRRRSRPV